jgi:phospholipase C
LCGVDTTPELMIAMNDVATGMLLDALSHSPEWPSTLLIVTEDDPQDGFDHVDEHRTPLFMASPWIKRGYVSHTRIDTASIHKLLAHLFAKPYNNARAAEAAVPFDAFTSTPDFTPYTYAPLATKVSCNPASTKSSAPTSADREALESVPDQAPWIRREVIEHMRALGSAAR